MLCASVRIVCMPSPSCSASPGVRPNATFQYCDVTSGQFSISKIMFIVWKVAVEPPRRQTATFAAGLHSTSFDAEKHTRCQTARRAPFGWP